MAVPRTGRSGVSTALALLRKIVALTKLPRFWTVLAAYTSPEFAAALTLVVDVLEVLIGRDDQFFQIDLELPFGPEDQLGLPAALALPSLELDMLFAVAKHKRGL